MTTIVLADEHVLLRIGLRTVLEREPAWSVVGEATDGLEAVELVARLGPDILIVALMLPHLHGLDVIRQVRQRVPRTQVIVLSMHASESFVLAALRNGAAAYVLKTASSTTIIEAVHAVLAGRPYLSTQLAHYALERYVQSAKDAPPDPYESLTMREREVLYLAAQGESVPAIAQRLGLSARTVETHRTNFMRKLSLRTQTDLIRYALQHGLLPVLD